MLSRDELVAGLARWLPPQAVERVADYMLARGVSLRVARPRSSRLGDYRQPRQGGKSHAISVDGSLGSEFFLFVLLHEMAHLENGLHHPHTQPHGHEWQTEFARLIAQYVDCFSADVAPLLARYASRVPLNRTLLAEIERRLRCKMPGHESATVLNDLRPGERFALRNRPQATFCAVERRRTRWLCTSLADGRNYLVVGTAEVVLL
ncbi:MAG: hypothetical protein IJ789_07825 [Bacteroidales bacterium]|nr:hypothetical protein [Bacteroidales bacterium]